METTANNFIDKAINGLKKAILELEEFQLQLALGKAEASDKYEEAKKSFNTVIHEAKENLSKGKIKANQLSSKFEELQLSLTSGKIETKEVFNEQKERILKIIDEIETIIKASLVGGYYLKLLNEIEKFKIKLEILRLRFELGKLNTEKEFEITKGELAKRIEKIKRNFIGKEVAVEKKWGYFCNTVTETYMDLRSLLRTYKITEQ